MATHEDFGRAHVVAEASDRAFGFLVATLLGGVAVVPLFSGGALRSSVLALGVLVLFIAWVRPRFLGPLNRLWLQIGLLLHRIVSPVVLAVLLYVVVTPVSLLVRLRDKDPLRLRWDPQAQSYWIPRNRSGSPETSMRNQF
jgi:hypothetical protein